MTREEPMDALIELRARMPAHSGRHWHPTAIPVSGST